MDSKPEFVEYKQIGHYLYDPDDLLGEGQFGKVYKGFDTKNKNRVVAIKVIEFKKIQHETAVVTLKREIEVLRKLKGEHVVELVDMLRTENNLYLIMEYCEGGDLEGQIKNNKTFSEKEALQIIKQIADAFVSIDKLGITVN